MSPERLNTKKNTIRDNVTKLLKTKDKGENPEASIENGHIKYKTVMSDMTTDLRGENGGKRCRESGA